MKRNDLSLFHLEREGFKIKLRKGVDFDTMVEKLGNGGMVMAAPAPSADSGPVAVAASSEATDTPGGARILSPMVGTFYRSAGPGEKSFVNVGDSVSEGSTVCIIEAMKVMNEIKAEISGVIVRVLVDDASPVQYETPLFEIKPA